MTQHPALAKSVHRARPLSLCRVGVNNYDDLRVDHPTAYGEVNGYTIGAQRRQQNWQGLLFVHLSAPDGRVLDLIADSETWESNAQAPTTNVLSRVATYAFRRNPLTPEQADLCAGRLDAVIAAGLGLLVTDNTRLAVRKSTIQCAAENLDHDTYREWAFGRFLKPDGYLGHPALLPRQVAWFIQQGFTPETARAWFKATHAPLAADTLSEVKRLARFRDHGWAGAEVAAMAALYLWAPNERLDPRWAPIGVTRTRLALRAGLSVVEATRMLRHDQWDDDTVQVMGELALLGP